MASARLTLSRLFNVSSTSPWICFGGSYAGSLAAWARLKVLGPLWVGERNSDCEVPNSDNRKTSFHTLLPPAPHPNLPSQEFGV